MIELTSIKDAVRAARTMVTVHGKSGEADDDDP